MSAKYRQHLLDSLLDLEAFSDELYFNITLLLEEIGVLGANEAYTETDDRNLDLILFANIADQNIQKLIEMQCFVDATRQRIIDVNAITRKELQQALDAWIFPETDGIVGWQFNDARMFAVGEFLPHGFNCPKLAIEMFSLYRLRLVLTTILFEWCLCEIGYNIINLGMFGDFAEENIMLQGESVCFYINDFENTNDQNIQELLNLYDGIKEIRDWLLNVNAVSEEELDAFIQEDDEYEEEYDDDIDSELQNSNYDPCQLSLFEEDLLGNACKEEENDDDFWDKPNYGNIIIRPSSMNDMPDDEPPF